MSTTNSTRTNLTALKHFGWKWRGGVYTGHPHLKSSNYLGDLWTRSGEARLAVRVEYGFAESFEPIDKACLARGPVLQASASRTEDRWIYTPKTEGGAA